MMKLIENEKLKILKVLFNVQFMKLLKLLALRMVKT